MLYVVSGDDFSFFQKEKEALKKEYGLSSEYVVDDPLLLESVVLQFGQQGFFDTPKQLIVCKYVFADLQAEGIDPAYFLEVLGLLLRFDHTVLVYEQTLSKEIKKSLDAYNPVYTESKKAPAQVVEHNVFTLTDLCIKRDKKNAWIFFSQLMKSGKECGEIYAPLFWAFKTLFLVKTSTLELNPEIKPYTFNKMKKEVGRWSEEEIRERIRALLFMSAQEQFSEEGFRMRLEQFMFSL